MATAASQSLRHAAAFLSFEADGSFLFACGPGAYGAGGWDGFGRFDAATGKATVTPAPIEGPVARAGDLVFGVQSRVPRLVDRAGAVRVELEPLDDELGDLEGAAASDDGRWIAVLCRRGLVLLDAAAGKRAGDVVPADAFAFVADELLLLVDDGRQLVRRALGSKRKDVRRKLPGRSRVSRVLQRREGWLLSDTGVLLDEKTGAEQDLGEHGDAFGWGVKPGTLVRARRTGELEVISLQGKVLRTFARPRRGTLITGGTSGGWFTCTTGSFIERYDLGQGAALPTERAPRKAPSPRKPVSTRASEDRRTGELLAAYWKNPDDVTPLRVWADLLIEHGDPRGEFIQLSLLAKRTPEQEKRHSALRRLGGPRRWPPSRRRSSGWRSCRWATTSSPPRGSPRWGS